MKIDYTNNPLGIIKKFRIPYVEELHLIGRIIGIAEEGFNDANFFRAEVVYPPRRNRQHHIEIGGNLNNYQELRRCVKTPEEAERKLKKWCGELGFKMLEFN